MALAARRLHGLLKTKTQTDSKGITDSSRFRVAFLVVRRPRTDVAWKRETVSVR